MAACAPEEATRSGDHVLGRGGSIARRRFNGFAARHVGCYAGAVLASEALAGLAGRLICWDLDRTLGVFRPLGRDRPGPPRPGPEIGVRARVREVIRALDGAGALQVITTASTPTHAEAALERAGIRGLFRRVYTGDDLISTYGPPCKDYRQVAHDFGLFGPEVGARMIVVGDTLTLDLPTGGPVFVWERAGTGVSAALTLWILATRAAAGGGDFRAGYRALNHEGGGEATLLGGELGALSSTPAPAPSFILKLWMQSGTPVVSLLSELPYAPLESLDGPDGA
jgi:hypothetical protein